MGEDDVILEESDAMSESLSALSEMEDDELKA